MNILFCIKAMNKSGGGAERVLAEVASELAARGNGVTVLSFDDVGGASFYPLHAAINRICLGAGADGDSSKTFRLLRYILIMRRTIRRLKPDAVVGFMHSMYIPLGLALIGTRIRVIASEHIVPEHYQKRPLQAALVRITPFFVDAITCVSEQVKQAFSPFLRKKMVVVPNPVDITVTAKSDTVGATGRRKTLLAVGRLDGQKDHRVLIDAFATIAPDLPEWDLRIVGEGELKSDLVAQVDALGLADRVFLPGGTQDISSEYQAAQLFAQPSRYESYGLTVVEALSHGLPPVGFDTCIGVNQLIRPGRNGVLVDGQGDKAANLAAGLKTLMIDPDLRRSLAQGAAGLLDAHRIDRVGDEWAALLRRPARMSSKKDLT